MPSLDDSRDRAVHAMFDRIAGRYDFLNRVISFRLDAVWRAKAIKEILQSDVQLILDLGSGTGDLTFSAANAIKGNGRIVGLDFSLPMLMLARAKRGIAKHGARTDFIQGSALFPPFKDGVFDGVMTAFVLRNVSDLSLFFSHAFRVLKKGGRFVSLDMFPPSTTWFSALYSLYFYRLVPWIGGALAHDHSAYRYLARSVESFYSPQTVVVMLEQAGFERVSMRKFFNGAVCMHVAEKFNASPHAS